MRSISLPLKVLRGALIGAVIATLLGILWMAVAGLIQDGIDGFFTGLLGGILYYSAWVALHFGAPGLVLGGIFEGVRNIYWNRKERQALVFAQIALVTLLVAVLIAIARFPAVNIGIERQVRHGARWFDVSSDSAYASYQSKCSVPVILLVLTDYTDSEIICSANIVDHLQPQPEAIVPITYRVTYDFGEPRSYQLIVVGDVSLTWEEWLGGPSGCGGSYMHACNSPQQQRGSPLYESSWQEEQ